VQSGIKENDESTIEKRKKLYSDFFNTFSYGNNKVNLREAKSIFELLAEPFEDTCVQILVGAAFVSIGLGVYQNGW